MIPNPSLLTAAPHRPVLLVFTPVASAQRVDVERLVEKARVVLNPTVQILCVNETTHPEVVSSFQFTSIPAFVLLQRGLELWRYTGPVDSPDLLGQLSNQMEQVALQNP